MILEYPEYVAWEKNIDSNDGLNNFNTRQKKYLISFLKSDNYTRIHYKIETVNDDFLNQFIPFYTNNIESKKNPYIVDIKKLIDLNAKKHSIYTLSIYEDNVFVGGSIFTHRKESVTTSVKSYVRKWSSFSNSVSPTLLAELYFYIHAKAHNYAKVSHGKDRNPYGLNSNINLCATKLQLGYTPRLPKKGGFKLLDTASLSEDILILLKPESGEVIKTAILFSFNENHVVDYNYLLSNKTELDIQLTDLSNHAK
jgi:hypothetical protein